MDAFIKILIGFFLAILLHELTHLLVICYYKIPFKAIVMTKWSSFGFLVENKSYIDNNKILVLLHFLPLIWCLMFFIDPYEPYIIMFPLVNIFGGLGDIYKYIKIMSLSLPERIEWANGSDDDVMNSIVWMKKISKNQ